MAELDNIFDLETSTTQQPDVSSQTGQTDNIFDLATASPVNVAQAKKPEQKSESNTLWGDAKAETVLGEFGAGLQSGVRQTLSTFPGLAGLAASYVDEGTANSMLQWSKEIAEGGAQRGIGRIEDLTMDPMTWARYVAGVTGEAVPFILSIMSGAGAGSLLVNMLTKKGVNAATKSMILSSAPAFGGAFATAGAIETAATAQELYGATGEAKPLASLMAGTAKGALESLFPMVLARQFGLTIGQGSDLYGRLLGTLAQNNSGRLAQAAGGVAMEGLTELMQEEVDIQARNFFDTNYAAGGADAWSRRMNALVAGGVGGGVFSLIHPGQEAQTVLDDKNIRDAVGETPTVFGADVGEMPSTGPEHIIRTGGTGLDATAGLASGDLLNAPLSSVDLRNRGLYGAVVPGRDILFGTQDQANNDWDFHQGTGFVRLDSSQVTRGDITASTEDLPDTLNDPRVDFTDKEQMTTATEKLALAIKLKQQAANSTRLPVREQYLDLAQKAYREAIDAGARVEPILDGQVMLRNPQKASSLLRQQATVDPQISRASLLDTRTRDDGKTQFYVMAAGAPKERKRPGGKAIDLENVSPDDITGLPNRDLARQVIANQQISRKLDVPSARARGIRFLDTVADPKPLLQELVNILQAMPQSVRFHKQKGPLVERFMKLVDAGLRLDVSPETQEFAVLRQMREKELVSGLRDEGDIEVVQDANTKRLVKQRARREREPRVSKKVVFQNQDVMALFYSQFHNTGFQNLVTGHLDVNSEQGAAKTPYSQVEGRSPIINFLRELAKSMKLKTDFLIEIVGPGALDGLGVRYIEDKRSVTEGGPSTPRTIIQIDPWIYGDPTAGGKPLRENTQRNAQMYVAKPLGDQKVGLNHTVTPATKAELYRKLKMTEEQFAAQFPGATHFYATYDGGNHPWTLAGAGSFEAMMNIVNPLITGGSIVQVNDIDAKDARAWKAAAPGVNVPRPKYTIKKSIAGRIAEKLGVVEQKMFTSDLAQTEFYTDFTRALGEIIFKYEWGNLSSGEMDLIKQAYSRETHVSRSLGKQAALARVFAHPVLQRAIDERGPRSELYNFEEWLVQQVSRALINPKSPIGIVQQFINKIAVRVKNMLESFAKLTGTPYNNDPKAGQAATEVQNWIEKLVQRGTMGNAEDPFLTKETAEAVLKAIKENQDALKGWNMEYVAATPQRASTVQVRKLLEFVPKEAVSDRKKLEGLLASADRHNTILEWLLGIHQLADLNPHIEPLRRYVSLTRAMEDDALSWATMADERLRQAQALPKDQQRGLWKLMNDLDQMVYLDQVKLKAKKIRPRWPTPDELLILVRQHKLSKEAFEVYKNIRTDYLSFLTQLEITAIRNAEETISDPVVLKAKTDEISGEIAALRSKPYFPHMRFGKYIVTVRANNGEVKFFAAFDTKAARDGALVQIAKDFAVPQVNSIVSDEMSPHMQQFQGLPRFALEEVKKALGLDADVLTESQKKDRDALEAMAFEALPVNSFRHNLAERANTPGYSMDGLRAYATYFARSARFVARMGYSHQLQEAVKDVRRTASPVSKDSRTRIADYMQQHFDAEMNPVSEYATVRALGFLWYFAFTPAAAFVNLSQVPMVTYPYLASKFPKVKRTGTVNALKVLNENIREMSKWLKGAPVENTAKQEALEEAAANRVIDDGFAQELAAVSQGSTLSRTLADGKAARSLRLLSQWGTYPFAAAERFNRSVTFRTAWDLAIADLDNPFVKEAVLKNEEEAKRLKIDRGWGDDMVTAYIFAAQAVRDTQFEYSRWARPKIMQGGRSVLFMFKSYLQNMLFFMFKANRGTQIRFMLLLLAMAGVMGMPGAEDMEEIAKWLGRKLGFDINPQMFIRRMLVEYAGGTAPDVLLHGASRVGFGIPAVLNGLGVPAGSADLSGSLSMGRLVPGLAAGLKADTSNFTEMLGDLTREIAGPVLGVPFALYQSIVDHSLPADDPKRWERAMPRALRDVTRSSRYLAEQRERDTRGSTVVQFDPNDLSDQMDALAVGFGFRPTQVTRQWDAIEAQREVQMYWKGQRKLLMDAYARARRLNDVEGTQDARTAIKEFNAEVPYGKMKITQDSLQKSIKARKREREAKESRTPVAKGLQGVSRDTQALFPEAPPPRPKGLTRRPAAPPTDLLGLPAGPETVAVKTVR